MLDIDIIKNLKVGDIILVHGESTLGVLIKDFQSIKNHLQGKWTHSMTVCEKTNNKVYVSEAIDDRTLGGICKTDFQTYLDEGNELIRLRYKSADTSLKADLYKQLADYYCGRTNYNFVGLLQQAYRFTRLIFNKDFVFHVVNTVKRFMCGSWGCFNIYYIYNDEFFKYFTSMGPIDEICSDKFDIQIIDRS